ncbi:MAG: hypothetical protein ACRD0K_28550 [Egibacteraceae bacterium]
MDAAIAAKVHHVPRAENADPAGRVIVATAEVLSLPVVSSDPKFRFMTTSAVIWR